jgi:hypothetical protein
MTVGKPTEIRPRYWLQASGVYLKVMWPVFTWEDNTVIQV